MEPEGIVMSHAYPNNKSLLRFEFFIKYDCKTYPYCSRTSQHPEIILLRFPVLAEYIPTNRILEFG